MTGDSVPLCVTTKIVRVHSENMGSRDEGLRRVGNRAVLYQGLLHLVYSYNAHVNIDSMWDDEEYFYARSYVP